MRRVLMVGLGLLLAGCATAGTTLEHPTFNGCVYGKGNGAPFVNAGLVVVGTVGEHPPTLAECWNRLPALW